MSKTDLLYPSMLCAALLGTATLVFAVTSPRQPVERSDFVEVAVGDVHAVGLAPDGTVWAWGRNDEGQLGDGTRTSRTAPAPVPGLDRVEHVIAHHARSIALKRDGSVWVWGRNGDDRFGEVLDAPTQVTTLVGGVGPHVLMAP
ncbi:MAG: hypothetical protein ABW067_10270 [Rhizobacter sp.]